MQNFQDIFQTRKRSFTSAFSICMTVRKVSKVSKVRCYDDYHCFIKPSLFKGLIENWIYSWNYNTNHDILNRKQPLNYVSWDKCSLKLDKFTIPTSTNIRAFMAKNIEFIISCLWEIALSGLGLISRLGWPKNKQLKKLRH